MKKIIFLSVCLLVCFNYVTRAQDDQGHLYIIELNTDNKNFVDQLRLDVLPGDSIQFKSTGGNFAIYIINAINFLALKEQDLKVWVNSDDPDKLTSPVYEVQSQAVDNPQYYYSIYCITDNSWPEAPPRIIIKAE